MQSKEKKRCCAVLMSMQRREFMLASAGVVGATSIGAVAFTQGSVSRDVSVDIVADDAGPITLVEGNTAAVSLTNGQLVIDTPDLNGDGSFTYGDNDYPWGGTPRPHAFKMTNNSGGARDFTFGLSNFSLSGSSSITLGLVTTTGPTHIGDVTTGSDVTEPGLPGGEEVWAVLTFDTSGLTSGDSMNGDFTIDAV